MSTTRRDVIEELAVASDAVSKRFTTVATLAEELGTDEAVVRSHVDSLVDCELATVLHGERIRITVTGEELLELDVEIDDVVVEPKNADG
jgi:hypothetical protein